MGGDATNERTIPDIFAVKRRPRFNPLICARPRPRPALASSTSPLLARRVKTQVSGPGQKRPAARLAGALKTAKVSASERDTVAIQAPAHAVAQSLLREASRPIAPPSANGSGRLSPTEAAHVAEELGDCVAMILDDGCPTF
jgi:L-threonylcarbamoyladenylate synthase